MTIPPSETRSLDRAIDILELLGRHKSLALHELHAELGLPKTTLRRLLGTMVTRNLVRVGLSDGKYRSNCVIPQSRSPDLTARAARLVSVAVTRMQALSERIGFPVDLHVCHDGRMHIVETTNPVEHLPYGGRTVEIEVSMFAAASGLAILARLPTMEREHVIALCDRVPDFAMLRFWSSRAEFNEELAAAAARGYGLRRQSQRSPDWLTAAAVAVRAEDCWGALAIWWPKQIMDLRTFEHNLLPALRDTAQAIEAALQTG